MKSFETREKWWMYNIVNTLKANEWYTLKWLIACHVNFISIKKKEPTMRKIHIKLHMVYNRQVLLFQSNKIHMLRSGVSNSKCLHWGSPTCVAS